AMRESVTSTRCRNQQLSAHAHTSARDVVAWMGAIQAQDPAGARWAVGVRLAPGSVTEQDVQRAIDDGSVVRVHAMRFTWQLVAAEDARWILALVGGHVLSRAKRRHTELGIDARTIA